MSISNPTQLVDEFKKSGEFDRLRRELFSQFQQSDGIVGFKSRIEEFARQRLKTDQKLRYMPQEAVHKELMQEMDRYPVVERAAAADVPMLGEASFAENIKKTAQGILREGKGQKSQPRKDSESIAKRGVSSNPDVIHSPKPSTSNPAEQDTHAIQSPNVMAVDTPPSIIVLENTPIPAPEDNIERQKVDALDVTPGRPEVPTVTLTTVDDTPKDVDMADESQQPILDVKTSSS